MSVGAQLVCAGRVSERKGQVECSLLFMDGRQRLDELSGAARQPFWRPARRRTPTLWIAATPATSAPAHISVVPEYLAFKASAAEQPPPTWEALAGTAIRPDHAAGSGSLRSCGLSAWGPLHLRVGLQVRGKGSTRPTVWITGKHSLGKQGRAAEQPGEVGQKPWAFDGKDGWTVRGRAKLFS